MTTYYPPKHRHENLNYHDLLDRKARGGFDNWKRYADEHQAKPDNVADIRPIERRG